MSVQQHNHMLRQAYRWLKRNKIILSLFVILAISCSLRLINYEGRTPWFSDVSRDILVAYHIAQRHEYPRVGPVGSFLPGEYFYPPYYYYLIGAVAKMNSSFLFIGKFYATCLSFLPLLIFGIGISVFSFSTGLFSGLMVAIASSMVQKTNVWSPYISTLFLYGGILLLIVNTRTHLVRLFGIFLLIFSTTIHLSCFVPAVSVFIVYILENKEKIRNIVAAAVITIILYASTILYEGGQKIFLTFQPQRNFDLRPTYASHLWNYISTFWLGIFDYNHEAAIIALVFITLAIVFWLKYTKTTYNRKFLYIAIPLLATFVAAAFKTQKVDNYVLDVTIPLAFLLIGAVFGRLFQINTPFYKIFSIASVGIVCICLSNNFKSTRNVVDDYIQSKSAVSSIVQRVNQLNAKSDYVIFGSSGKFDYFWDSPKYWYFVEHDYGIKLTRIVDWGENIAPIGERWRSLFLICDTDPTGGPQACQSELARYLPGYRLQEELGSQSERFRTFYYIFTQ